MFLRSLFISVFFLLAGCSSQDVPDEALFEQAENSFSKGWFIDADKNYKEYLRAVYNGQNRYEAWERIIFISDKIYKNDKLIYSLLESMYLEFKSTKKRVQVAELFADHERSIGNNIKALELYREMLRYEDSAGGARILFKMAQLSRQNNNFNRAFLYLDEALKRVVSNKLKEEILYENAQICILTGKNKVAEDILRDLYLNSKTRKVYFLASFSLVDILEQQEEFEEGFEILANVREVHPNPSVVDVRIDVLRTKNKL